MSDNEKNDMLIEWLLSLYRIKATSKEENSALDYEILSVETRLTLLGMTDFSKLKL